MLYFTGVYILPGEIKKVITGKTDIIFSIQSVVNSRATEHANM